MYSHINASRIITDCCRKNKIKYTSPNYSNMLQADALEVHQLYLQVKIIMGKLAEIGDRHSSPVLKELIKIDLKKLDKVDHDFCRIVKQIMKEKKR